MCKTIINTFMALNQGFPNFCSNSPFKEIKKAMASLPQDYSKY